MHGRGPGFAARSGCTRWCTSRCGDLHEEGHTPGEMLPELRYAAPSGYRTALRLMRMADRFGLPVVTFVDTWGMAFLPS